MRVQERKGIADSSGWVDVHLAPFLFFEKIGVDEYSTVCRLTFGYQGTTGNYALVAFRERGKHQTLSPSFLSTDVDRMLSLQSGE